MTAALVSIAEGVRTLLAAHTFPPPFDAEPLTIVREYVPRHSLKDLETRRVIVMPSDAPSERGSRQAWQHDYEIDVAIQFKLHAGDDEKEQGDKQLLLAELLEDFLKATVLPSREAALVGAKYGPIFDPEHLEQCRVLTTLLTFTYRGWR